MGTSHDEGRGIQDVLAAVIFQSQPPEAEGQIYWLSQCGRLIKQSGGGCTLARGGGLLEEGMRGGGGAGGGGHEGAAAAGGGYAHGGGLSHPLVHPLACWRRGWSSVRLHVRMMPSSPPDQTA